MTTLEGNMENEFRNVSAAKIADSLNEIAMGGDDGGLTVTDFRAALNGIVLDKKVMELICERIKGKGNKLRMEFPEGMRVTILNLPCNNLGTALSDEMIKEGHGIVFIKSKSEEGKEQAVMFPGNRKEGKYLNLVPDEVFEKWSFVVKYPVAEEGVDQSWKDAEYICGEIHKGMIGVDF